MKFLINLSMISTLLFSLTSSIKTDCAETPIDTIGTEEQKDTTYDKIHVVIQQKLASFTGKKSSEEVVKLFAAIKEDLQKVLAHAPEKHNALKNAVNMLDPKSILTMITHIKTILNNIDPKTKELILLNVPAQFKPFIA